MRKLFAIIAVFCVINPLWADSKLTGTPISSFGSFDYNNTTSPSFAVNLADKAFDGDAATYFAAWDVSYGWVGLDLGKPHTITILGWMPRTESVGSNAVLLGIFEGANRADFMDAVPLYIITETSHVGQMNYARVECSRGFRYVRYVGPYSMRSSVAELEFYGDPGVGDDSQLCQLTNLPVVSIHTKDNQIPVDKVNEIEAYVSIISQGGKHILSDTAFIRERGNASREFPKKPYRIKFQHKQRVLNSPAKAKKWTLINNYGDKTLMRNQLAFELSRRLGMPYTPFCAYVDVILNGEYKGCYQLCDQIDVRPGRVDIAEMLPTDNSGTALTGGYLIEVDAYANGEPKYFISKNGTPVTIKSPDDEDITTQQYNYIANHFNNLERDWKHYLDLNTFLRHFLTGEMAGNTDTYWSVYMYKHRNNDTLFVGPVWDFDIAFDNDNRTYPVNNKNDYIYRSGGSCAGAMRSFVDKILADNTTKQMLYSIWDAARRNGLNEQSLCDYVDQQAQILDQSQRLNYIRWPMLNKYVHMNPRIWGSYEGEVKNVKNFINKRIPWFDKKLNYIYTALPAPQETGAQTKKILRDGNMYIIRGDKTYTITGIEVK